MLAPVFDFLLSEEIVELIRRLSGFLFFGKRPGPLSRNLIEGG
jgi:hypothetical protein